MLTVLSCFVASSGSICFSNEIYSRGNLVPLRSGDPNNVNDLELAEHKRCDGI